MYASRRMAGVLIVEKEPAIALILEDMLIELGFERVRIAYDAAALRDALGEVDPDLAILEIAEPADFLLAERLRSRNVAILFSTGRTPSELPPCWRDRPLLSRPPDKRLLYAALRSMGFD